MALKGDKYKDKNPFNKWKVISMSSFHKSIIEFRQQLEKGAIIEAYSGLMAYFRDLRSHFQKNYPDYSVPSNIYYGYLDMTYFSIIPSNLKPHNLKVAVVFVYGQFRFEVWLSGVNRKVQEEYWHLIKDSGWDLYHLSPDPKRLDYILDQVLVEVPDFVDLGTLTEEIESGTNQFINNVEDFLLNIKKN